MYPRLETRFISAQTQRGSRISSSVCEQVQKSKNLSGKGHG
jgi:hypothetical protein